MRTGVPHRRQTSRWYTYVVSPRRVLPTGTSNSWRSIVMIRSSATPWCSIAEIVAHSASNSVGGDGRCRPAGMDAGHEQRLGAVDVADPTHHLLVKQQLADRRDTSSHARGRRPAASASSRNGSGPRRATIRSRSSAVPIEHSVGPVRSMVRLGNRQAHAHVGVSMGGSAAVHTELAEQAEVHVADQAVGPPVEQVLAEGFESLQLAPSTRAASASKRPCGDETATGLPRSSLEWSMAIRWMV